MAVESKWNRNKTPSYRSKLITQKFHLYDTCHRGMYATVRGTASGIYGLCDYVILITTVLSSVLVWQ